MPSVVLGNSKLFFVVIVVGINNIGWRLFGVGETKRETPYMKASTGT